MNSTHNPPGRVGPPPLLTRLDSLTSLIRGWGWEPLHTDFESCEMDIYNEGADITGGDDDEDIKQEY